MLLNLFQSKHSHKDKSTTFLEDIQNIVAGNPDIFFVHDVVSLPVTSASAGYNFQGGLAQGNPLRLIEKAILVRHGNKLEQVIPEMAAGFDKDKMPMKEETVFYGGIFLNNFGHFLLESISRLWAYALFSRFNLPVLFYAPWGVPDYLKKDNYINQILSGFGIPAERIVICKDPILLKAIIIPEQKYGFGKCRTPDQTFLNFIHSFIIPEKTKISPVPASDRIYVSRSRLPFNQGRPVAETMFETFLQANKYTIIHPETLTLYQQLMLYKNARQIIFCDGGAMYATVLLPSIKANIAIVARRRDYRWNYKELTEHFVGYQKQVLWIDEVVSQYQFGMETWDALGDIDYHKTSLLLQEAGFVESVFETDEKKLEEVKKKDLQQYIDAIRQNPLFINYMTKHFEQHPLLPSTL